MGQKVNKMELVLRRMGTCNCSYLESCGKEEELRQYQRTRQGRPVFRAFAWSQRQPTDRQGSQCMKTVNLLQVKQRQLRYVGHRHQPIFLEACVDTHVTTHD